jgi:hypothetical protein
LRLTETTAEYAYFTQLGVALFGDNGLLTTLGRLEALGVGCLNESGSLVLGTLVANCDEMSVGALTRYLNELVSERSVFRGLSRLERQGIITKTSGRVRLSAEWEQQFERLLTDADECCPRKRRGDSRRKLEQAANLARLRKGLLTDAERSYLKSQNCVYCDATGLQQQHFPPKKFIEDFTVINNRHFIWPICAHCNDAEKNFIRSLPPIPEIELFSVTSSDTLDSDLLLLYRRESEKEIMRFHEAHMVADRTEAYSAILRCVVLWMSLDVLGLTDESDRYDPRGGYLRDENTLRVPLRLRIREAFQNEPGPVPWLNVTLRLEAEVSEFSYGEFDKSTVRHLVAAHPMKATKPRNTGVGITTTPIIATATTPPRISVT